MQISSDTAIADQAAYLAAVAKATRRARSSYFDQHVIMDSEAGYLTIDEGDYVALPISLIDRVVYSVPGGMSDEF